MQKTEVLEKATNEIVDVCQNNDLNAIESQIVLTVALHSLTTMIYQEAKDEEKIEEQKNNCDVV